MSLSSGAFKCEVYELDSRLPAAKGWVAPRGPAVVSVPGFLLPGARCGARGTPGLGQYPGPVTGGFFRIVS